jgi:hypothetical protein
MKSLTALIAMISFTAPPTASTDPFTGRVMPARFYHRLAQCETGKQWLDGTTRKNYTSGFGIARGVWMRYSNSSGADRYTPAQQAVIVDRIAFLGFTDDSGRHYHPVGLWGWGVVKSNCMGLQGFICRSKKEIVQRQKRNCR